VSNAGRARGYWSCDAAELLARLGTSKAGLAQRDAEARLECHGENSVTPSRAASTLRLLLGQVENPLVLILIFGAGLSLLLRQWTDASIILLIVVGSCLLAFTQEYRASAAMARLRDSLALRVTALRDGARQSIDASHIVPGDVVELSAGNLVPADGIVLECRDFLVSQAALTGESFPVEKAAGPVPANAALPQRTNSVFLGTSVRSGTAKVLIVETGLRTEFGNIAGRLATAAPETEFAHGLRQFGYLLTRVMVVMVLLVLTINLLQHRPLVDSLLFAVALAVGLSPELLPAIVSVTLSSGARQMARQGVIVRRLEAIENLGSIDILCTDKTGTLTKGIVELSAAVDAAGVDCETVRRLALINAALQTGIDNPLDAAIVSDAETRDLTLGTVTKADEIPYDFLRKRLTVVVVAEDDPGRHRIVTKGAFDTVLDCCRDVARDGGVVPLDAAEHHRLRTYYEDKGAQGFRVLGLATRLSSAKTRYDREDEADMTFVGFLLFFDPLKEGIGDSIRDLARLGISVKIVTGDNRFVAAHVGEAIGLDPRRMLTGIELNDMRNEALWHLAETTHVFAEIDPQLKERIVRALQHRSHAVAYMGDGINDAPALHVADVGVSVDQAVDVARASADVVLLRQDLDVLRSGVLDGRRTFANTLKYITITTSANFGNMISMALATLFVPFLPLAAKQILLNNFLSDFPSIAISTDNVDKEATETAQRWSIHSVRSFMVVFGLVSTAFDLFTFVVLLELFNATEALFQSTWFVVSLLTELAVVLVLRTHLPCWRSEPSKLLLAATVVVSLLAVILPYAGALAKTFGFVPLPLPLLIATFVIVLLYVITTEVTKLWFYGRLMTAPAARSGTAPIRKPG
jgi:Mg2+-importing ATPase